MVGCVPEPVGNCGEEKTVLRKFIPVFQMTSL